MHFSFEIPDGWALHCTPALLKYVSKNVTEPGPNVTTTGVLSDGAAMVFLQAASMVATLLLSERGEELLEVAMNEAYSPVKKDLFILEYCSELQDIVDQIKEVLKGRPVLLASFEKMLRFGTE